MCLLIMQLDSDHSKLMLFEIADRPAPVSASLSATSLPGIPMWLGTQIIVTELFNDVKSSSTSVSRFGRLDSLNDSKLFKTLRESLNMASLVLLPIIFDCCRSLNISIDRFAAVSSPAKTETLFVIRSAICTF